MRKLLILLLFAGLLAGCQQDDSNQTVATPADATPAATDATEEAGMVAEATAAATDTLSLIHILR